MWQEDYERDDPRYRRRYGRGGGMEEEEWFEEENPGRWRGAGDREGQARERERGSEYGEGRRGRWGTGSRYQSPYQSTERERYGGGSGSRSYGGGARGEFGGSYGGGGYGGGEGYREGYRESFGGGQQQYRGREGYESGQPGRREFEPESYQGRGGYGGGEGYLGQPRGYENRETYGMQGTMGQTGTGTQGYRGGQSSGGRYGSSWDPQQAWGSRPGLGQRQQDFTGKGPKGWTRSDDRIKEDLSEQFARHPDLDPSEIEIRVQGGEVTLTGSVNDRESKRLAEDIAENVQGVKDVTNQVRVSSSQRSGATSGYGTTGTGSAGTGTSGTSEAESSRSRSGSRSGATT